MGADQPSPGAAGSTRRRASGLLAVVAMLGAPAITHAQSNAPDEPKWKLSGDFRLRLEQDWDSQNAAGVERDNRLRARIRARLGFAYSPTDVLTFGLRLASGSDDSQQSPHISILDFDDNSTGDADFNVDKAFVAAKAKGFSGWAGRNGPGLWKPNELVLDDDVSAAGVAGSYSASLGEKSRLTLNGGYYSLPAGMRAFAGNLGAAQLVFATQSDGGPAFTLAAAALRMDANPEDPNAALLRNSNGARDYMIWVANGQVRLDVGGRNLTLGADYMTNSEDYAADDPDSYTAAHHDQTQGYDVYATLGGTKEAGDWQFGAWYTRIEALAVNPSYAQDDWVRWGSATQTDSSDLKGFELRAAVGLGHGQNLMARLYLVEAITSQQDGKRFRIDYNVGF
jgi:hypothetical protein